MVLLAALMWGTTGTARALAPSDASPLAVGAVRIAIGGSVLIAIALARRTLFATRWPIVPAAFAAAAVAGDQLAFFEGVAPAGGALGAIPPVRFGPAVPGGASGVPPRGPPR